MTQPLDRLCILPELGEVDTEMGEFWVGNPFLIPSLGKNLSAYERNRLYLNIGGTDFIDGSFASNADIDADSRSVVAADFNNDGAPDLLVGSVGGGPLRLFLNRYPQMNRVRLELTGTESNRAAVGARVVLHCGKQKIVRDLFPVNGFMGQAPASMEIGVGQAKTIDLMEIRWPSGQTQIFENIPVAPKILIREGKQRFEIKPA